MKNIDELFDEYRNHVFCRREDSQYKANKIWNDSLCDYFTPDVKQMWMTDLNHWKTQGDTIEQFKVGWNVLKDHFEKIMKENNE